MTAPVNTIERRRTADVISSADSFSELLLPSFLTAGLSAAGFQKPSPVQQAAIPLARAGLDVLVQAKSGTGKTAVFGVACLEGVKTENKLPQALIVAPTREIALQIAEVIRSLASQMPRPVAEVGAFIGGLPIEQDQKVLRRVCHIAVGTPGRVCALIEKGDLVTPGIRIFVLDEADNLMSSTFASDVFWLHSVLPKAKQVLAFSATYTSELQEQVEELMREPQRVLLASDTVSLVGVRQYYRLMTDEECRQGGVAGAKMRAMLAFLCTVEFYQVIVFCNQKSDGQALAEHLKASGFPAAFISGDMPQTARMEVITAVRGFSVRAIISTDLAARGLDLEKVNVVVNLDLPLDPATYMHRIGRTGRFGSYGLAATFVTEAELSRLCDYVCKANGGQVEPLPPIVYEEDYARPQPEYVIESKVAVRGTVTPNVEEPAHLPPASQSPNPGFGGASRQSVSFEEPASTAQQASNNGMSESPQQDGGSSDAECAEPAEPSSERSRVVEYSAKRVHTANGASGQIQAEGEMNAAIPAAPDGGRHAEGTRSLEEEMPSAAVPENAALSRKEEVAQSGNGASQLSQEDLAARYPKLSPGKWWSGPFPSSENQQGLEAPTWVSKIQAEIAEGSADGEGELEKLHRMLGEFGTVPARVKQRAAREASVLLETDAGAREMTDAEIEEAILQRHVEGNAAAVNDSAGDGEEGEAGAERNFEAGAHPGALSEQDMTGQQSAEKAPLDEGLTGLQVSDFRGGLGQAAATLASYQALSQEEQLALWETYYQQNNGDQTLDGNGTADDDGSHLKVWQQWYRAYTGSASSRNLADDESAPGTTVAAKKFPGASPSYARGRSSEDAGPAAEERWMTNHTEEDGEKPEAPEAQRVRQPLQTAFSTWVPYEPDAEGFVRVPAEMLARYHWLEWQFWKKINRRPTPH